MMNKLPANDSNNVAKVSTTPISPARAHHVQCAQSNSGGRFANSLTLCFASLDCGADHLAANAFYCSKPSYRNGHRRGFLHGSDLSGCLATDQESRTAVRNRAGMGRAE